MQMAEDAVKQRLMERIQAYQEGEHDAEPNNAILRARIGHTLEALLLVQRYALSIVGASEAYGETKSAHLWQEVADIAEKGLYWATHDGEGEGYGRRTDTGDDSCAVSDGGRTSRCPR